MSISFARSAPLAWAAAALVTGYSSRLRAGAELIGMEVSEVREAEHALKIHIDGFIASADLHQVIVNQGDRDTEVFYSFDLPRDAAVIGADVRLPNGRSGRSSAVDSRSIFRFVSDDAVRGAPDLGLLRMVDPSDRVDEATTRYELRVYPVPAGKTAVISIRWIAPLRYRDGRLTLRLADRGAAANLVREHVEVSWRAPSGARGLREIRVGETRAAGSDDARRPIQLRFDAPVGSDLVFEARPVFASGQPLLAELATVPIKGDRGAFAFTLLAPKGPVEKGHQFDRILLVLDASRSMGQGGLAAEKILADALLTGAAATAGADAVVFDRSVRPVMGSLSTDRKILRDRVNKALSTTSPANGSDLGGALGEVGSALRKVVGSPGTPPTALGRDRPAANLVVIVTDGVLPLEFDENEAASRIGTTALNEARVSTVLLVPDQAPLPELDRGPLADLARRTGGRMVAVRTADAAARAQTLFAELGQPAPVRDIQVTYSGAEVSSGADLPGHLESGEGAILLGWYSGRRPTHAAIRADLRGKSFVTKSRPGGSLLSAAAIPLTLVGRPTSEIAFDEGDQRVATRTDPREASVNAAARAGVATSLSSLIVLDPADGFATDRLAMARKWGWSQYRRFPPPAERAVGEVPVRPQVPPSSLNNVVLPRRTGELDRTIVERLMKQYVVPRARACYERALRREPTLTGAVTIQLEMIRGVVLDARLAKTNLTNSTLASCLIDAAYATPVPRVALGDASEVVVVARYPLRFRKIENRIDVSPSPDNGAMRRIDPDDPLGGLDR
jgi:Arc/MetJ family transcription regulator